VTPPRGLAEVAGGREGNRDAHPHQSELLRKKRLPTDASLEGGKERVGLCRLAQKDGPFPLTINEGKKK